MGKWFGLEEEPWNWHSQKFRHITLGNQTIAHLNYYDWSAEPNISLVFSDHLGSASILADSFGRLKTLYDYYPFGSLRQEVESGGHLTAQRYTGQELDEELDLYNYGARFYDQEVGRFNGVDPVGLKLAMVSDEELKDLIGMNQQELLVNPQQLNLYAYTVNNPIKYVDPDGNFRNLFDGYLEATNRLANILGSAIDRVVGYLQSQRETKQNDYASQYEGLSEKEKSFYGSAEQYGQAMVMQEDVMNAVMGMVGGGGAAKSFDAAAQQSKMLEGVVNGKAINAIKSVFKTSDTIPGGTMGALRNEIMTGLKTKEKFHVDKAWNVINSIKNIFKTQTLNSVEMNRLQGIKNSLESLIKKFQ